MKEKKTPMRKPRKPIEGNRRHDVLVSGAEARAMEVAATALDGDNVTQRQAESARDKLMEVAHRYREVDRPAARKAAKAKKDAAKK